MRVTAFKVSALYQQSKGIIIKKNRSFHPEFDSAFILLYSTPHHDLATLYKRCSMLHSKIL